MGENTYSVYMHRNKKNSKVYIGITCRDVKVRWGNNGNGYKPYYGHINYFWNSIEKNGWDGFYHYVIQSNMSKEDAENMEIRLIKYYDSTNPSKGYNIQNGGSSHGCHNEATKIYISEVQKKTVYQYDRFTGRFLNKYECTLDAENKLNIPNTNISSVCLRKMKTAHNYIFRYASDGYKYGEDLNYDEVIYTNTNNCSRKVLQYDFNGDLIGMYDSISQATKITNTSKSSISGCLSHKNKTGGNFIWRYYEDIPLDEINHIEVCFNIYDSIKGKSKNVLLFTQDGQQIKKFKTSSDAASYIGVTPGAITYAFKKSNGKIKNYVLKYA